MCREPQAPRGDFGTKQAATSMAHRSSADGSTDACARDHGTRTGRPGTWADGLCTEAAPASRTCDRGTERSSARSASARSGQSSTPASARGMPAHPASGRAALPTWTLCVPHTPSANGHTLLTQDFADTCPRQHDRGPRGCGRRLASRAPRGQRPEAYSTCPPRSCSAAAGQ